ncbi:CPBP family intramembrane glutamic endopeptidase [Brevibacterium sp. CFH 10365]|uniref:CPBP family intramembrane glutamic endopeptidase n=1 Tax=Brevibacterium sp. CFH 10365 TaxID=2585207 RepID=UPI00126673AF|nr:CPBP family intramembrane glutamic endopeptidase [Brevibacterium sp. CFH 10365]
MNADTQSNRLKTVPWRAVGIFVLVSFGLAWLIILPLWLNETDSSAFGELSGILPSVMMYSPLVAVVAVYWVRAPRGQRLRFLGIWPLRPAKRVVWFIVTAAIVPLILVVASLGVSVLFGWIKLDLTEFSGMQSQLDTPLDGEVVRAVVLMQLAMIPLAAVLNSVATFGEEIGWRGWLLPTLRPLGMWPALLLSGAIWGLWHAPVTLLGHNFNEPNVSGVVLMTVGSIGWGIVFGWLRLRSGSLWPAVVGHGALNAAGGLVLIVGDADTPLELALVNPLGVSGWFVLAVMIAVLVLTGQFNKEPQLAVKPAE